MKKLIILAVFLAGLVAGAATPKLLVKIGVEGEVNVSKPSENVIEVEAELNIEEASGEKWFENIAEFKLEEPSLLQVYYDSVWEGDMALLMDGVLILKNHDTGTVYEIRMPCIINTTECSATPETLPGITEPVELEPGRYTIHLGLMWSNADGRGEFAIWITMSMNQRTITTAAP